MDWLFNYDSYSIWDEFHWLADKQGRSVLAFNPKEKQ